MISETVLTALIAAVAGSGGVGAVLAFLGKRSSDRAEARSLQVAATQALEQQKAANALAAEQQKAANALAVEQQNQKNNQDLIVTLNTQVTALRLQQSEDRGTFRADITTLTETNNKLEAQIDQLRREDWTSKRELEDYKRCSSITCPFKALRLSSTPGQT